MDQQQCLQTPSHFTYLGVCYVGDQANLTLSNPVDPQPTNWTVTQSAAVPEPGILPLMILGLVAFTMRFARK